MSDDYLHDSFPHDEDCENDEIELVSTGNWEDTVYYDVWKCEACDTIADEEFHSAGFVDRDDL